MRSVSIAALIALGPCGAFAQGSDPEARCASLGGLEVPGDAMLITSGDARVETANFMEKPVPYCQVNGTIAPLDSAALPINFQVNLPAEWNGKGLHYGGGGYNGTLVTGLDPVKFNPEDKPTPVARGYATWGSDGGNQAEAPVDGRYLMTDEGLANFGGAQLRKTYDVALAVIQEFYDNPPERVYFQGSSQGGHEAMIAIQRWPDSYDGAIVIHPANPFVGLQLSGNRAGQALYAQDAWLSPEDVELLNGAVLAACDTLDGAEDGLIAHISACGAAFDVQTLRCDDGASQHGQCLGDAQIAALDTLNTRTETPALQGGAAGFSGWPIYLGADLYGLWGMGRTATPANPPVPVENFGLYVLADPALRYAILRDPDANTLEFDAQAAAARITEVSEITDAVSADMAPFADKGGKVLLLHGTTDFAIPFGNTMDWYQRVVAQMGEDATRDFMRFWLVPGFGHGSGEFQLRWDSLDALEAWVEDGTPPEGLIATDAAPDTAGRSRPLCEYPAFAMANEGANDLDVAASFSCAAP